MRPVLVIEDDEIDIDAIREGFRRDFPSRDILFAKDGAAALRMIFGEGGGERRHTIEPALIILDLSVPVVSGTDMLERIKRNPQTSYIPIVVFTDFQTDKSRHEAYELGANAYVVKPFSRATFIETVCRIGKFWIEMNRLPPSPPSSSESRLS